MSFNINLSRVPLLIYQMPKTGSQTVEATLEQCRLPHRVFRFHFLSPQIAATMRKALQSGQASEAWKNDARKQLTLVRTVTRLIRIRRWLSLLPIPLPKIPVITGVREPIGLGLSSVFENHSLLFPSLDSASIDACRVELLRPKALVHIQQWFDLEIKPLLGIDVYQHPFPCKKGYAIYENRFVRLLVYRSDFLPKLPGMLKEFLGCEVPSLVSRNMAALKPYSSVYADAKARLRLPRDCVVSQYNQKLVRHFFSNAERRRLLARWAEETDDANTLPLVA